jgi:hypothetical protein
LEFLLTTNNIYKKFKNNIHNTMSGRMMATGVVLIAGAWALLNGGSSTEEKSGKGKKKTEKRNNQTSSPTPPPPQSSSPQPTITPPRMIVDPPSGAASPAIIQQSTVDQQSEPPLQPSDYHTDESESIGLSMVRSLSHNSLNNMVKSLSHTSLTNLIQSANKRLASNVVEEDDEKCGFGEEIQPAIYHSDENESLTLGMVRVLSRTRLSDLAMSPTQNLKLDEEHKENVGPRNINNNQQSMNCTSSTGGKVSKKTIKRSGRNNDAFVATAILVLILGCALILGYYYPDDCSNPYHLFMDVLQFKRKKKILLLVCI